MVTGAVAPGSLYLVATPIGHLGDLSPRAAEILGGVDVVLAEDTRHTRPLLTHLGLATPLEAVHAHNERETAARLVARLVAGASAALVSDAGTPLVSDPGAVLVAAAIDAGVPVVPVPGPSAVLAALTGSGLPAVPFTFFGFLPRKGPERRERLADLGALRHTAVVYESPQRLGETLADLSSAGLGGRRAAVARELTKKFEEFRRGTVDDLAAYYAGTPPRGEVVLVLEGGAPPAPADAATIAAAVANLRRAGRDSRTIQSELMDRFGLSRNAAYRAAHAEEG